MKNFSWFRFRWLAALTAVSVTWVNFNQERWLSADVIKHDIVNYNAYLPALFYHHDLTLSYLSDTMDVERERQFYAPNYTPEGKPVIKMSMGMAVSYLPFFGMAHVYATAFGYPTDGFSEPYHFALLFSSLFYHLVGLYLLWKLLRFYFTEQVTFLTLFCVTFSTNVFYYLTLAAAMTHTVDFALYAWLVLSTVKWHRDRRLGHALSVGASIGLLTLVRPINMLAMLFFLLYEIRRKEDIYRKLRLLWQKRGQLLLAGAAAFLIVLPQLLYWKYVTGSYFFNSYVGERFYFDRPHVLKALFGFRKGWLIYTPLMIFSLLGFRLLWRRLPEYFAATTVFFLVYIYVAFSWWCWWYGGSFGQRVLIDVYPVLSIPLAAVIAASLSGTRKVKRAAYALLTFFTALNLFQCMQAKYNIIDYDSMTARAYWRVFGATSKSPDREKYLHHPDYEKAMRGEDE